GRAAGAQDVETGARASEMLVKGRLVDHHGLSRPELSSRDRVQVRGWVHREPMGDIRLAGWDSHRVVAGPLGVGEERQHGWLCDGLLDAHLDCRLVRDANRRTRAVMDLEDDLRSRMNAKPGITGKVIAGAPRSPGTDHPGSVRSSWAPKAIV